MIKFSENDLNEFLKIINELSGMDLSEKRTNLNLRLPKFLEENHYKSVADFLAKLKFSKTLRQQTLDLVTISETYFLREVAQLKEIIFYAKQLERRVSILSAPCASGEEVYSLAMLGVQNFVKDMYILGVDINSSVINKAKAGVYTPRSLQNLSVSEKKRFFSECEDGLFQINKSEFCHCKFELCNVFDYRFEKLGKFDVILSRNMIIYFDYDSKLKLLEIFYKMLSDTGRLYFGTADLVPDNVYFRKVFSTRGNYWEKILQ